MKMYVWLNVLYIFMCLFVVGTVMPCAGCRDLPRPAVQPSSVSRSLLQCPRPSLPLLRPDNEISACFAKVYKIFVTSNLFDAIGREVSYLFFSFIDIWTKNKNTQAIKAKSKKSRNKRS